MSTPAAFSYILFSERAVGQGHDTLTDVINRPVKFIMTQSDFGVDDLFPGFMARWTGTTNPEGVLFAPLGHAYVDTSGQKLYIKMTSTGNTGWAQLQSVPGASSNIFSNSIYLGTFVTPVNTSMNLGLTINQGAFDDEILCLKSSDVAHGMTGRTETDSYGIFKKNNASQGGLYLSGLTNGKVGVRVHGQVTSVDANSPNSINSCVRISGSLKSGVNTVTLGVNGNLLTVENDAVSYFTFMANGDLSILNRMFIGRGQSSSTLINTNTKQTSAGLTIDQASDDEIFSMKANNFVAHGVTTVTETDTYFFIKKRSAGAVGGGAALFGLNASVSDPVGIQISALAITADSTKSNAGRGTIIVDASLKSGVNAVALAANNNIISFSTFGTTRFILDSDGDSHQDVGTAWTNFDEHNDIELLERLSAVVTRKDDPLLDSFSMWMFQNKSQLERLKLVTFNENGHHFVNMSRLAMLSVGALRQMSKRIDNLISQNRLLPA